MRNGSSIKCNKRGKRGTDADGGREGASGHDEFDVGDIHGKSEEGEGGDVSQHSQSYKFQEPSMLYLGMAGNLRRDGKGGRIKVAYSARGRVVYHHDHCNVALVFAFRVCRYRLPR